MDQQSSERGNDAQAVATVSWNPFVCQDCRGVFRVPRHHAGRAVVCPLCDRLLRLPEARESLPPLVEGQAESETAPMSESATVAARAEEAAESESVASSKSSHERIAELELQAIEDPRHQATERSNSARKRKHRRRNESRELGWENKPEKRVIQFGTNKNGYLVIGALVLVLGLVLWVVFMTEPAKKNTPALPEVVAEPPKSENKQRSGEVSLSDMQRAQQVLSAVLEAKTVDALLPHIRRGQALEQRVRSYHASHALQPTQLTEISEITQVGEGGRFYQVLTLLGDGMPQTFFLERRQEGFLIDWESWVGWSAQELAEVVNRQLKGSFVMRLRLESETYYNFDFPPDQEHMWQSYRLQSPDGAVVVHGYAPKASAVDADLRLNADEQERRVIVRFRYPEGSTQRNQFLIEEVLSPTWFMAE